MWERSASFLLLVQITACRLPLPPFGTTNDEGGREDGFFMPTPPPPPLPRSLAMQRRRRRHQSLEEGFWHDKTQGEGT